MKTTGIYPRNILSHPKLSYADMYRVLIDARSRRQGATAIEHNGGQRRVYGCVCGSTISMCARWPMTQRVHAWHAQHADCLQPVIAKALARVVKVAGLEGFAPKNS